MTTPTRDLLLEIGCEELPASFVETATRALPGLAQRKLAERRIAHGAIRALGTPRRLALWVRDVATEQPNLEVELIGPPVRAAFKDDVPTKAAVAFAEKLGVAVEALRRVETPKGEYLAGTQRETGQPAIALLPGVLLAVATSIPFQKSMRWGDGDFAFGRPIQWIVALFGEEIVPLSLAGIASGRASRGHRFLHEGEVSIAQPAAYIDELRRAHVLVDPEERASVMRDGLLAAATALGGQLIEDEFLIGENLSLVEEPHVIAGGYDEESLALPERVILEVAKGHQRYFGVRGPEGGLLPRYLAVVNTAEHPEIIRLGNDRVMRARLADARFFYQEDLKVTLAERRTKLGGIVFQKRLGTMLAKADRIERLVENLGQMLKLAEPTCTAATSGAHLAKCDLVTLMVGEFPELQGEMGRAYALAQGVSPAAADAIRDHYLPKGAFDATPPTDAAALVSLADRLDTLVGCFGIGLVPTGAADPYALRRACMGVLRTLLDRGYELDLSNAFRASYATYESVKLDVSEAETENKLGEFFKERLRGLLEAKLPADAVAAALAIAHDRPLDARTRATAIAELGATVRAKVGEVFKRATNIASTAPAGEPSLPEGAHASETALFTGYHKLREALDQHVKRSDYAGAFREIEAFEPLLSQYFVDVYVMSDEQAVRDARLRLMRAISETCSTLAKLELLAV
jgi:glycyl-tRNA synthetase beta chain